MTDMKPLVLRVEDRHREMLAEMATEDDRSMAFVLRRLIEQAYDSRHPAPAKPRHEHRAVRKNSSHLDVCDCGAVLGKDFQWRMP